MFHLKKFLTLKPRRREIIFVGHRPCHTALTIRDRGGLTPTHTDLFGGKKSLNTSVEQRNERADGEVYKKKKEQFNTDLIRKLITGKLPIQFSFDMVNKRNGHVSLIVLLGIVSRGIATMDLATSHPRHRRFHIDVTYHPHCMLIDMREFLAHFRRYFVVSPLDICNLEAILLCKFSLF